MQTRPGQGAGRGGPGDAVGQGDRTHSPMSPLSGPSPPSPSCFSSPCSSSRRRSRSWSMTQKNLRATVTRARSSKLKRRSPQQDREWRTILRANHSFRISRVPGEESCQKVDPGCPKVLKPFIAIYRAVSDQCTTKELTLFYNFFGFLYW